MGHRIPSRALAGNCPGCWRVLNHEGECYPNSEFLAAANVNVKSKESKFLVIESCDDGACDETRAPFVVETADMDKAVEIALVKAAVGESLERFRSGNYAWKGIQRSKKDHSVKVYEIASERDAGLQGFLARYVATEAAEAKLAADAKERAEYERLRSKFERGQ